MRGLLVRRLRGTDRRTFALAHALATARERSIVGRVKAVAVADPARASATPPMPKSAKIELTAACDLRCFFCASQRRPRIRGEMPRALFRRLARELREAGVEQIGLFYIGESFVCDWLPEAVRYAKRDCGFPYVFLTTNGLAATHRRVRACMEAGLDSLKFAFNWRDPRHFARTAGADPAGFARIVVNVRAARRARDEVEAATGRRCALYASGLRSAPGADENAVLRSLSAFVDECYSLPLVGTDPDAARDAGYALTPRKALPCGTLFTEAHITWNGRLSACGLDASERFHMADLKSTPFAQAWTSAAFQALRHAHLAGNVEGTVCERCLAYD